MYFIIKRYIDNMDIHDLNNLASEMKYYQEILSTKPNACVYDIHGKNVYAADCE